MSADAALTDVILLCGGLGTRLGKALGAAPKPMALIGNKPFLQILVDQAARRGFKRFIFCVGHRAEVVEGAFHDGGGLTFVFSRESSPLGTGGALKLCEPLRRSPFSLVMNGDSFCDIDLAGLLEFASARGGVGAIAAARAEGRVDGGFIESDADGRITAFRERTPGVSSRLNAGIYALGTPAFSVIPSGRPCSLETGVFPALIDAGLYAYPVEEPLYDIGTPERLEAFRRRFSGEF